MRKNVVSREELLELAGEIIKHESLEACTVRRLAKEAGIATGTIYNYYKSRTEFLEELFKASWKKTIKRLSSIDIDSNSAEVCLMEYMVILEEDIDSRGGLGGELYHLDTLSPYLSFEHETLFFEMEIILSRILLRSGVYDQRDRDSLLLNARWLFILCFNIIINKKTDINVAIKEFIKRFFS